jgi:hypothetical protein
MRVERVSRPPAFRKPVAAAVLSLVVVGTAAGLVTQAGAAPAPQRHTVDAAGPVRGHADPATAGTVPDSPRGGRVVESGAGDTAPGAPTNPRIDPDFGCATTAPGPAISPARLNDAGTPVLRAGITDPDQDALSARFVLWPVADPAQRHEMVWPVSDGQTYAQVDIDLADATGYAWQVRGEDGTDVGPWSDPCHFTVDRTAPPTPTVSSAVYPSGSTPGGGPGVPGSFAFTADGSADVVAYEYRFYPEGDGNWRSVPGGSAAVDHTPTDSGYQSVSVRAVDPAGNRSYETDYSFTVRETRPFVFSSTYPAEYPNLSGGIGVPGVFDFHPGLPDVVSYAYRLDDGPESTVAAGADHEASVTITPTRGGDHVLRVVSTSADGQVSPPREYRFTVDTGPLLSGPDLVVIGSVNHFPLTPRMPGVVAYEYWFEDSQGNSTPVETIAAGPDGTAELVWTPTTSDEKWLRVRSRGADGTLSTARLKYLSVDGAPPDIERVGAGAVNQPSTFTFRTRMRNVAEYTYTLNSDPGTRTTVPARPDGTAVVTWTPVHGGYLRIDVVARTATGIESTAGALGWFVDDSPTVTSAEFPRQGRARLVPGSFRFASAVPNTVTYEYTFGAGTPYTSLPAGPDGTATLSWTPDRNDTTYGLRVRSRAADGIVSATTQYTFTITSGPEVISDEYPELETSGSPGTPGTFTFRPGMPNVTEYTYQFRYQSGDAEPEVTVAADADGVAGITWTPTESTGYILVVRSRTATGTVSADLWYWFSVGWSG